MVCRVVFVSSPVVVDEYAYLDTLVWLNSECEVGSGQRWEPLQSGAGAGSPRKAVSPSCPTEHKGRAR